MAEVMNFLEQSSNDDDIWGSLGGVRTAYVGELKELLIFMEDSILFHD